MRNSHQSLYIIITTAGLAGVPWAEEVLLKNPDKELTSKISNEHQPKNYLGSNNNFTGFFTSALLGYKQTSDDVKETFIGTGGPFNDATGQKTRGKLSAKTITGGVNFGYGYQWLCSYFGLDVEFNIGSLSDRLKVNKGSNYDFSNHTVKTKRHFTLESSLKYGFVFGNTMPYIKAGIAYSEWRIKSNYFSLANLTSLGISQTHHKNKNRVGFLLGSGVDFKHSQHLILGGYVTYMQFNTLKYVHPLIQKTKITPSDLCAGLKISYLF